MIEKTALREVTLYWIRNLPKGQKFTYQEIYTLLERGFPHEVSKRGDARNEPRYKHDARLAVWDALKKYALIRHTGVPGQRERV